MSLKANALLDANGHIMAPIPTWTLPALAKRDSARAWQQSERPRSLRKRM